jgi:uncharacterized repeat protein (TIGR01451 family)
MESRVLLANVTVISTGDDGSAGTLRWAILQVNADSVSGSIGFNIPGTGVQVISVSRALPPVTRPVVIDGTTQPGFQGRPLIQIDGTSAGSGAQGLVLSSGGSVVRGLAITDFSAAGLVLNGGAGNLVQGNVLGADPGGSHASPNGDGIQIVGSSGNTIGGSSTGAGNLISGNLGSGIRVLFAGRDSSANLIEGNRIGTTADGTSAQGNHISGVLISGASANQIGGSDPGTGNVISGNLQNGVEITAGASGTLVAGNLIGTSADGQHALGNQQDGIRVNASANSTIGGNTPGAANLISSNLGDGIETTWGAGGTLIVGNSIGTDLTGILALGNHGNGVTLGSSRNSVGGLNAGAGNVIAFNGTGLLGAGVQLVGMVNQNRILSNSIHDNAGLGINLGSGPTPNHAPGQSQGPNNYQNYPVLSPAQTDGQTTTVNGNLLGQANTSYTVQFFWSPTADPSGYGEGQYPLGTVSVTTDATGNAKMSVGVAAVPPNSVISATATDPAGNTSEFSPDVFVRGATHLVVGMQAAPNPVGVGANLTYVVTVTNKGSLDAHNVVLTEALPGLTSVISVTSSQGAAPQFTGQFVSIGLGTLPAGSSATVTVVVQVLGGTGSDLVASASVQESEIDPSPQDESVSVKTHVAATADLGLGFTASAEEVHLGDSLTWTLTASNAGPATAHDVMLSVPLAGLTASAATSTQGTVALQSDQVIASLGDLVSGSQVTIRVQVRAATVGKVISSATLSADEFDPTPGDNTASTTLTVLPVTNLGVTITADRLKAASGQTIQLTIKAVNKGADATGVILTDTLPAGLAFVSATSDLGPAPVFTAATGIVSAAIGDFPAGAVATLTISATVTATPSVSLVSTASVSSNEFDTDPSDNTASCSILVRPVSGLAITLAPSGPSVPVGQQITYAVSVTNHGPVDEPDAVVVLPLPGDVSFISAQSDQGVPPVFAGGVFTADLGGLAGKSSAHLSIVVTPGVAALGNLTLTASAQGQDVNPDPTAAQASATVTVTPTCGLAISLAPQAGPAHQGADLTYVLTVVNGGPLDATNVVLTSPLPTGVGFVSASADGGASTAFANGQVNAGLGTVATGQSVRVKLVVKPSQAAPAPGGLTLTGSVSSDTFDPDLSDHTAAVTVPVAPSDDLGVSLIASPTSGLVEAGDAISLTAAVANHGPSRATRVVLSLPLSTAGRFLSAMSTQGTVSIQSGVLNVQMGSLDPGSQATISIMLTPTAVGIASWTATVGGTEFDLVPSNNQATASMTILEPPGSLAFASPSVAVSEAAGFVDVPVLRSLGAQGTVTVHYQTSSGNATPGLDYVPVSGILTFAEGETLKSIRVPILANPHDRHDEYVGLTLDSPTQGAVLGSQNITVIRIVDIDPDVTPPQVAALHWSATGGAGSAIIATFSEPVQVSTVLAAANYQLADLGTSGQAQPSGVVPIPLSVLGYDPGSQSVALAPSQPLFTGHFYRITIAGSGATPILDLAGNPLAGASAAGTNYVALFGSGTTIKYTDRGANQVTLKVTGPGYLDLVRDATGEGQVLRLQGGIPGATGIQGTVARSRGRGTGTTSLDTIEGLGQFGDIRVKLTTPPFLIRHYPFFLNNGRPIRGALRSVSPPRPVAHKPVARPLRLVPQSHPKRH